MDPLGGPRRKTARSLSTRRREEEERKEREQRLAVRRMFEDGRILEREKEMRELQKVFVEGQDPRIDQMAVKYRIEVLQETLETLHEDSGTLCDFAVKARRLGCVKLGLLSPAEARNIQTVYEALPMKDWPAEDANVLASDSDDANEGAGVESTPESCCVRESGREEEDEPQIFITQVPSSQRMQDEPEQRPFLVHKGRGKKRKNTLSHAGAESSDKDYEVLQLAAVNQPICIVVDQISIKTSRNRHLCKSIEL